jgi:general secretion pathway protein A
MANPAIGLKSFTDLPMPIAAADLSIAPPALGKPPQALKSNGLSAFGLTANPFSKSSIAGYLPLTASVQFAIAQLMQGIESRQGLLVVTGEPGTGKTTVLNQVRTWLAEKSASCAFLFNPLLDTRNFFDFVLSEFGVRVDVAAHGNSFTHLSNWLFARHREGALAVLIVDEAQGLSPAVLQALGCLLNLEVSGEKLLQIVLSGQLELNDRLRAPDLRQFRQRIAVRCRTAPLTVEETQSYVLDRLRAANANGKPVFSPEALDTVRFYSAGVPRVINLLCEHALVSACRRHVQPVPPYLVEEVAQEFQLDDLLPRARHRDPQFSDEANARMMRGSTILADVPVGLGASSLPVAAEPTRSRALNSSPGIEPPDLSQSTNRQSSETSNAANVTPSPRTVIAPVPQNSIAARHDRGWVKVYSGHVVLPIGRHQLFAQVVEPLQWLLSVAADKVQQTWRASLARLKNASAKKSRPAGRRPASLTASTKSLRQSAASLSHWLKTPMRTSPSRHTIARS